MAVHKESPAKQMTREMLHDACEALSRPNLTYLGMPSDDALDLHVLRPLIKNVICVEREQRVLENAKRSLAPFSLKERRFLKSDIWNYLRDEYPSEPMIADVTFLDFYGGGLQKKRSFAEEFAGIRSYFAKHARLANRSFVFAWTYNPRDQGMQKWRSELGKIVTNEDQALLNSSSGVKGRSVGIRLLIRQSMREHNMRVQVYHHARYKRIMNTLILCFSSGVDPNFDGNMEDPDTLLESPIWEYDGASAVPRAVSIL